MQLDYGEKYKDIYDGQYEHSVERLAINASDVILYGKSMGFHNLMTGERNLKLDSVVREGKKNIILTVNGVETVGYFCYYNRVHDVIVIKFAKIDTRTCPHEGEIRQWKALKTNEYANSLRAIYDGDVCMILTRKGECFINKKVFSAGIFSKLSLIDCYGSYCFGSEEGPVARFQVAEHERIIETLRDFYGYVFYSSGFNYYNFDDIRNLEKLVNVSPYKELSSQGKYQKDIDIPLKDLSKQEIKSMQKLLNKNYPRRAFFEGSFDYYMYEYWGEADWANQVAVIHKVRDGLSVIRVFLAYSDSLKYDVEHLELPTADTMYTYEFCRVYVTDDEIFVCKKVFDKWKVCQKGLKSEYFSFFIVSADEDAVENCKLRYFKTNLQNCIDISKKMKKRVNGEYLWSYQGIIPIRNFYSVLSSPIYEGFVKSELSNLIKFFDQSLDSNLSPKSRLKAVFGEINDKEKNFAKAIGVPMFMLKKLNSVCDVKPTRLDCRFYFIKILKELYQDNMDYLASMDQIQFDKLLDSFLQYFSIVGRCVGTYYSLVISDTTRIFRRMVYLGGCRNLQKYIDSYLHIWQDYEASYGKKSWGGIQHTLFDDFTRMSFQCKELVDFQYKFANYEDFIRCHDYLVYLMNEIDVRKTSSYQKYDEKFESLRPKWEKFEFSDEEYSITYPKNYRDVVNEGMNLHHCVKTYINDIYEEKTLILFIRKNECLGNSFFTLEVKNNKIRQCHGFANCNTNTVDGLEDFLKSFCKAKNIEYADGHDLLAAG